VDHLLEGGEGPNIGTCGADKFVVDVSREFAGLNTLGIVASTVRRKSRSISSCDDDDSTRDQIFLFVRLLFSMWTDRRSLEKLAFVDHATTTTKG
jgi:hypothetical protein